MAEHDVRRLPVVNDNRLVGIISQADIARQTSPEETGDLVAAIFASPPND